MLLDFSPFGEAICGVPIFFHESVGKLLSLFLDVLQK